MTAAELLAECQARRIALQAHGQALDIDAPAGVLTPDLLARLRDAKPELLAMLQPQNLPGGDPLGDASGAGGPKDPAAAPVAMAGPRTRAAVPVAVEWPAGAADFALLLTVDDLPSVPFKLNAWTEVQDAGRFLRWLRADIRRGPGGPRAFYGALQCDLLALQGFALQAADKRQQEGKPTR